MEYATAAARAQSNSVGVSVPKSDGLTSCLQRIQDQVSALNGNNEHLIALAIRIGGHEPEQAGKDGQANPMPDNALFLARQIENSLNVIIDFQRYQLNRIDSAIS